MNKLFQIVSLVFIFMTLTGCSTGYWAHRGRDAADIFTATLGTGLGAKARVGPMHTGLLFGFDHAGLRGGEFRSYNTVGCGAFGSGSIEATIISAEHFAYCEKRGKNYGAYGYPLISFVCKPKIDSPELQIVGENGALHPYYTQIEVAIAIFGMSRVGFNPGELVDFIMGWTTIDIFNDDV